MTSDNNPYEAPSVEVIQTKAKPLAGANVTTTMIKHLQDTRPWVRFISILGFISVGLFVLFALIFGITGFANSDIFGGSFSTMAIVPFYIGIAVLYFFPVLYMHRFAVALKRLLAEGTTRAMEEALKHQKSFWKFSGIFSVVLIGIVVLGFMIAVFVGIISASL